MVIAYLFAPDLSPLGLVSRAELVGSAAFHLVARTPMTRLVVSKIS